MHGTEAKQSNLATGRSETRGRKGNQGARPCPLLQRTGARGAWTRVRSPGAHTWSVDSRAAPAFPDSTSPLGTQGQRVGTGLQTASWEAEKGTGTEDAGCLARSCYCLLLRPFQPQCWPILNLERRQDHRLGVQGQLSAGTAGLPLRNTLTLGPGPCSRSRGSVDPVPLQSQGRCPGEEALWTGSRPTPCSCHPAKA